MDRIIVHTSEEFIEALKEIEENTVIIFNDKASTKLTTVIYPAKIDAREYEKKRGGDVQKC